MILDKDPSVLDAQDVNGNTALQLAVVVANMTVTRYLLSAGANMHIKDNEKHTLAHWAAGRVCIIYIFVIMVAVKINSHNAYRGTQTM